MAAPVFPYLKHGCLLSDNPPEAWRLYLDEVDPDSFMPKMCLTYIYRECCEVDGSGQAALPGTKQVSEDKYQSMEDIS